ncbi:MAG TPA: glycosyltransferase family 2 protein [Candidatus Sumerlaeota bacterium]|nr:glycosyltransferase family 2 protein [Candidatus Sumerlaeota bacterium]
MRVSIVIPIYNEEDLLEEVLQRVLALPFDKQLILVDDHSSDRTPEICQKVMQAFPGTLYLRHEVNQGKGAAIRTGIEHADGEILIIQDADLEYQPEDIPRVLEPILAGRVRVAYGSRFLGTITGMRLPNRVGNRLLAWLVSVLYGQRITDEATAYKAFRAEVIHALPLTCRRFEFCPEVTAKVLRMGERIEEVPVTYTARTFEEGKKISWPDFFIAVWTLVKHRF